MGILATKILWPQGCAIDEWRAQKVAGRKAAAFHRSPKKSAHDLRNEISGHLATPETRGYFFRARETFPGEARRCPLRRRIQRQGDRASRHDRNRAARRTHSRRGEHSVGAGSGRRWHLQARRRAPPTLWRQGRHWRSGSYRLLPHRRAQFTYLVRVEVFARLQKRPQLRWFVDRVGQPGRRPD